MSWQTLRIQYQIDMDTRFNAFMQDYQKSHSYAYHNRYTPATEMLVYFAKKNFT